MNDGFARVRVETEERKQRREHNESIIRTWSSTEEAEELRDTHDAAEHDLQLQMDELRTKHREERRVMARAWAERSGVKWADE